MNEDSLSRASADPWLQPLLDFWRNYVQQADASTTELLSAFPGSEASVETRRRWLEAAKQCIDVYLRSPQFLRAIKHNVDALTHGGALPANSLPEPHCGSAPSDFRSGSPATDSTAGNAQSLLNIMLETRQVLARQSLAAWERLLGQTPWPGHPHVHVTPAEVVYEQGTLKLLRYKNESAIRYAQPVIICFSLVNRPAIVDLQANRSVVRQLLRHGFDVYLIDWGVPAATDRSMRLHDYVGGLLKNVVDVAGERSRCPQVNLLGYCMGGTMAAMFAALNPNRVRNLILMAAPIDFSGEEGLLNLWSRPEHFDVDGLIDALGNCPGSLLQSCFQLLKPVQNYVEKYLTLCEKTGDDAFLENFFAMERWANDSIPVAGETFREFVKALYQENRLATGQMRLNGVPVDLAQITCPLLLLTADLDHLVPPSSTLALRDLVGSQMVDAMSLPAGHIGLAVSSKAHRQLWPAVAAWIGDRSTAIAGGD